MTVQTKCAMCGAVHQYDAFTYEGYNTFDGRTFYCDDCWGDDGRRCLVHHEANHPHAPASLSCPICLTVCPGDAGHCPECGATLVPAPAARPETLAETLPE